MRFIISSILISFLFLFSCGGQTTRGGEDYGDISASAGGLVLTEDEHKIGWGKPDCTMCHNLENIHLENRTDLAIDIRLIHEQAINKGICDCHGDNGVE